MMDKLVSYSDSESDDTEDDNVAGQLPASHGQKNTNSDEKNNGQKNEIIYAKKDEVYGLKRESNKRKTDFVADEKNAFKIKKSTEKSCLPLPDSIKTLFKENSNQEEDSSKHDGRIRSFPHMEGNWATYIYIPYEADDEFSQLVDELLLCLRPFEFKPMTDFHVSLSRTVSIRHHWIPLLTKSLKQKTEKLESFYCGLNSVKLYTNDEKTRSFLAVQVDSSIDLHSYTEVINESFKEFNLQSYYEEPSYHISIGWCLGDIVEQVTQQQIKELQEVLSRNLKENPELETFSVSNILCKTGNKHYSFALLS